MPCPASTVIGPSKGERTMAVVVSWPWTRCCADVPTLSATVDSSTAVSPMVDGCHCYALRMHCGFEVEAVLSRDMRE
jgi:hypothetical protein